MEEDNPGGTGREFKSTQPIRCNAKVFRCFLNFSTLMELVAENPDTPLKDDRRRNQKEEQKKAETGDTKDLFVVFLITESIRSH